MSVIAGLVRFSGAPVHSDDLAAATARLAAPGVGKAEYWIEGSVGLIVRQRVITNEDLFERQPWVGGGGRLILIYDGRLDNREELAAALAISLSQSEIVPDGLLLLRALERWGEAALPRLIGDFALALWDKQDRKLLLARDQISRRSLYYHQGDGFVAFATTYPALLALPGVPRKIDELGIADFLILNTQHPVETLYIGIRRVLAASIAVFENNNLRLSRYWLPEPKKLLRLSSDNDYVEAMREQLDRAVSCRLRTKDGIASTMTGGLDSSAVASTAARLLAPKRLLTVTTVPPEGMELPQPPQGCYNDERPYVTAIAELHPNIDLVLTSSTAPHWIETDPTAFFEAGGVPARNVSNIGWLIPRLEPLKQAGISALLVGDCGNNAWSWDGLRGLSDLFRQGHWLQLGQELSAIEHRRPYYDKGWKAMLRSQVLSPLEPPLMARWRKRLIKKEIEPWAYYSAVNPDFAREINLYDRSCLVEQFKPFCGPAQGRDFCLWRLKTFMDADGVQATMRALTGIETRDPLADNRLIEFCLSLPQDQYLKNGITRRLPRLTLADRLSSSVLEKDKIGIQNPEILSRMSATRNGLLEEIEGFKKVPLAARCLDLPRLTSIVSTWPNNSQVSLILPRAMNIGRFLRWAEHL